MKNYNSGDGCGDGGGGNSVIMTIFPVNSSSLYYVNSKFQLFNFEEDNYNKLVCVFPKERTDKPSKIFETVSCFMIEL